LLAVTVSAELKLSCKLTPGSAAPTKPPTRLVPVTLTPFADVPVELSTPTRPPRPGPPLTFDAELEKELAITSPLAELLVTLEPGNDSPARPPTAE
jgi:hypothetical protein